MNVRLTKSWSPCAVVFNQNHDRAMIANYEITINMTSTTIDSRQLNLAYERMQYWFDEIFQDSFLISEHDKRKDLLQELGQACIVFPENPVDQLVGIATYCKLTSIVQNQLLIDSLLISSNLDHHVIYHHYADDDIGSLSKQGWWSDSRPVWATPNKLSTGTSKVIDLARLADWKSLGLDWHDQNIETSVVVCPFGKNEKE